MALRLAVAPACAPARVQFSCESRFSVRSVKIAKSKFYDTVCFTSKAQKFDNFSEHVGSSIRFGRNTGAGWQGRICDLQLSAKFLDIFHVEVNITIMLGPSLHIHSN